MSQSHLRTAAFLAAAGYGAGAVLELVHDQRSTFTEHHRLRDRGGFRRRARGHGLRPRRNWRTESAVHRVADHTRARGPGQRSHAGRRWGHSGPRSRGPRRALLRRGAGHHPRIPDERRPRPAPSTHPPAGGRGPAAGVRRLDGGQWSPGSTARPGGGDGGTAGGLALAAVWIAVARLVSAPYAEVTEPAVAARVDGLPRRSVCERALGYDEQAGRRDQGGDRADRPHGEVARTAARARPRGRRSSPVEASAMAKMLEAMAPPMVLVVLVMPVTKPVRSGGAAAAAAAGRAATRAPEPDAGDRHVDQRLARCESWNGRNSAVAERDQQAGDEHRARGCRAAARPAAAAAPRRRGRARRRRSASRRSRADAPSP